MEEDLRPRLIPVSREARERTALRGFGAGLGILFFLLAWRARTHGRWGLALAALGALSALAGGLSPARLRPLYRAWMPVVGVLAKINLWLLSGILYYLVVTPYGLLLRAFGLRPLELGLREKDSYWEEKAPRDPAESARSIF